MEVDMRRQPDKSIIDKELDLLKNAEFKQAFEEFDKVRPFMPSKAGKGEGLREGFKKAPFIVFNKGFL